MPPGPVTPRTTFHCFSTTKPVTALAVLQLVMEGRVFLDEPLATYLPELPYRNGATVRQVLSHQAGFPNPLPLSWVHADADHASFDASGFLERVLREISHVRPSRTAGRYPTSVFSAVAHRDHQQAAYTDYARSNSASSVLPRAAPSRT
jgi:CubicO group peptidase (beta-lactamase class C family)